MSNVVEFPIGDRELNMSPYGANSQNVQYSLYGVCNHMGEYSDEFTPVFYVRI